MNNALEYVELRAKKEWDFSHSPGCWSRIFRYFIRAKSIRLVWIEQYENGDWDQACCTGKPLRAWKYTADGLSSTEAIGDIDETSAIRSMTPVIRFCVDEQRQRMIYTEWYGCRAGHGIVMTFCAGEGWVAVGSAWKS